jgi:anti-sigma B factor antagonist
VTFCDSTGISALIRGRRQADAHGVAYRVINPRGQVAEVLELTAVAQLFGCHKATIDSSGTRPATD